MAKLTIGGVRVLLSSEYREPAMSERSKALSVALSSDHSAVPHTVLALLLIHALLWSVGPLLFIDGMHVDTLEMTSWARTLALGYPKHPPLGTWLVAVATAIPGPRILYLLILSQLSVVAASLFIWKSVRLFAGQMAAAIAVIMFLETASATFFSVQVNHNSLSLPFAASVLFCGLRYLDRPSFIHASWLGLAAGLALLLKYETGFFHLTLVILSVCIPRFRSAWHNPLSYLAVSICVAVVSPHALWDWQHGWPTMLYAADSRAMVGAKDLLKSANELLDGLFTVLLGPLLVFIIIGGWRAKSVKSQTSRLGAWLVLAPVGVLIGLSLATFQEIRQGWLLPLAPAMAIGFGLYVTRQIPSIFLPIEKIVWRALGLSVMQVSAFALFIVGHSIVGAPVAAFSFDSSEMTLALVQFWRSQSSGELQCLAVPEGGRSITMGPLLYLDPRPAISVFNLAASEKEKLPCSAAGGVAVVPMAGPEARYLSKLGFVGQDADVKPELHLGIYEWHMEFFYLPPTP